MHFHRLLCVQREEGHVTSWSLTFMWIFPENTLFSCSWCPWAALACLRCYLWVQFIHQSSDMLECFHAFRSLRSSICSHLPWGQQQPAMALFRHFSWSQCCASDAVSQWFSPHLLLSFSCQHSEDSLCLACRRSWIFLFERCSFWLAHVGMYDCRIFRGNVFDYAV